MFSHKHSTMIPVPELIFTTVTVLTVSSSCSSSYHWYYKAFAGVLDCMPSNSSLLRLPCDLKDCSWYASQSVHYLLVQAPEIYITKSSLSKSMQPWIPPTGRRWSFSTSSVYIPWLTTVMIIITIPQWISLTYCNERKLRLRTRVPAKMQAQRCNNTNSRSPGPQAGAFSHSLEYLREPSSG